MPVTRWRRPYPVWGNLLSYGVAAFTAIAVPLVVWVVKSDGELKLKLWMTGLALTAAIMLCAIGWQGLYVSEHGVRIQDQFLWTSLRWSEIATITRGSEAPPGIWHIGFVLHDGRHVSSDVYHNVYGSHIGPTQLTDTQYAQLLAHLRDMHARHRDSKA